uniref:Uncharacterized protein n=1 Tax=Alexandrium monilatum TaxID=311494 RepID=A0A7S4UZL4_9DINO
MQRRFRVSGMWTFAALWNAFVTLVGAGRLLEPRWQDCCQHTLGRSLADFTENQELSLGDPWPPSCSQLMSLALTNFRDPAVLLWNMCYAFSNLLGKNEDGRISRKSIRASAAKTQYLLRQFMMTVIRALPDERMTWTQFTALWITHLLCKITGLDEGETRTVLRACEGGNCGPSECADAVADHAKALFEDSENWPYWKDATLVQRVFLSQALQHTAPEDWTIPDGITEEREELWTRFVMRVPFYAGVGSLREEEESGTVALQTAEAVVGMLEKELPAFVLLRRLGEVRSAAGGPQGALDQRNSRTPLDFGESRGCSAEKPSWATTTVSGAYLDGWKRRLGRATDHESVEETPMGPFAAPVSRDLVWSRKCGVVSTWADVPWARCAPVLEQCYGANWSTAEGTPAWHMAGVMRLGDTCRIVTNRAVLRSVLDGLLLGEDCKTSVGAGIRDVTEFWKLWPVSYRASPLAVELIQRTVLEDLLSDYYAAVSKLIDPTNSPNLLDLLGNLTRIVSHTFYYLSTAGPFHRGNPIAIIILHHAMWMRLASVQEKWKASARSRMAGKEVLRCLGLWRNGSYPTDECLSVRDVEAGFTESLYGKILDHPSVKSPQHLAECVAAALRRS